MRRSSNNNNDNHILTPGLNVDRDLWHDAKVFAAQKDTTLTNVVEHLLRQHLDTCKHDKLN
jgi:hypothetical protein